MYAFVKDMPIVIMGDFDKIYYATASNPITELFLAENIPQN